MCFDLCLEWVQCHLIGRNEREKKYHKDENLRKHTYDPY